MNTDVGATVEGIHTSLEEGAATVRESVFFNIPHHF
jgi:hypothetical protein